MIYVSTDKDAATTLVINKAVGNQSLSGYPKVYSILAEFSLQPAITANQWQKMSYTDRNDRINIFKTFIISMENIDVDATQTNSVFQDTTETPGEIVEQ